MHIRPLGRTGLEVSVLGFGAFKIGRNRGIKYQQGYELPDDATVERLMATVRGLGISYIDTAPAYGTSEERLGKVLAQHQHGEVISTKVGETFRDGVSLYDYSPESTRASVERSARRLGRDVLDVVLVHSDGNDLPIQDATGVVETLLALKAEGRVRAVGFSGKTTEGAFRALEWADVLMVEFHIEDPSHEEVIGEAHNRGIGVVVKKGLASGQLPAAEAIGFVLAHPGVSSLIVGSLDALHLAENAEAAKRATA
jgi:aryl-alcohol dehydrogenase-like predicted oxidoreductase